MHNRSNEFVYNVKIETVDLRKGLIFDPISSMGPNIQHKAVARWENNKSSTQTNYYYFFVGAEKEGWKIIKMHYREMNDYFFQIPMAVIYESCGVKWRVEFDFIYDPLASAEFRRKSGQRIS